LANAGRFFPSGVPGRLPRLIEALVRKRFGAVPGIMLVQLADLRLAWLLSRLLQHLHMSRNCELTVTQREMVATVVNGLIGGAP